MELQLFLDKDCWCYKYRPLNASLHTSLKASNPLKHAVHCGTVLGDEIVAILKCLPQNCPTCTLTTISTRFPRKLKVANTLNSAVFTRLKNF